MSTYSGDWSAPTGICFSHAAASSSAWITARSIVVAASATSITSSSRVVFPAFYSDYKTFHAQWRMRYRLRPSQQSGSEWGAWGSWTSVTDSSSVGYVTPARASSGNLRTLPSITLAYELGAASSTYDAAEYELRVRAYDTYTDTYGPWCDSVISVAYSPSMSISAVEYKASTVMVSVTTNWERGGTFSTGTGLSFTVPIASSSASTASASGIFAQSDFGVAGQTVALPYALIATDDSHVYFYDASRSVTISSHASGSVTAPTNVVWTDGACSSSLALTHSSATAVDGTVSWTDEDGSTVTEQMAFVNSGTRWTAEIDAPPLNEAMAVSVSVTVTTSSSTKWDDFDYSHTVDGDACIFSDGEDSVILAYRTAAPSRSFTPDVELVQLADGSCVSRHGLAHSRTWSISPALVGESIAGSGSAWHAQAIKLCESGHDWWFRTPQGHRVRVAVTGGSIAVVRDGALCEFPLTITEVG